MRRLPLFLLALASTACLQPASPSVQPPEPTPSSGATSTRPAGDDVAVVRIVDGDTIVVAVGGPRGTTVRLIGIDTPERNECFYRAAAARLHALVDGKRVRMQRDVSEADRYGRLLRYVYVGELFVNAILVSEGYANAATYPPDVAYTLEFVKLERVARVGKRGLWAGGCPL